MSTPQKKGPQPNSNLTTAQHATNINQKLEELQKLKKELLDKKTTAHNRIFDTIQRYKRELTNPEVLLIVKNIDPKARLVEYIYSIFLEIYTMFCEHNALKTFTIRNTFLTEVSGLIKESLHLNLPPILYNNLLTIFYLHIYRLDPSLLKTSDLTPFSTLN